MCYVDTEIMHDVPMFKIIVNSLLEVIIIFIAKLIKVVKSQNSDKRQSSLKSMKPKGSDYT